MPPKSLKRDIFPLLQAWEKLIINPFKNMSALPCTTVPHPPATQGRKFLHFCATVRKTQMITTGTSGYTSNVTSWVVLSTAHTHVMEATNRGKLSSSITYLARRCIPKGRIRLPIAATCMLLLHLQN